jgi:hypothetical protein
MLLFLNEELPEELPIREAFSKRKVQGGWIHAAKARAHHASEG